MKIITGAVTAALLVSACSGNTDISNTIVDATPTAVPTGAEGQCVSIKDASDGGDASLMAAFATPDGVEYGGTAVRELTDRNGYQFDGTEMVEGHCFAFGKLSGKLYGRDFNLTWRCPVTLISDDPKNRGQFLLEQVDDKNCDFKAEKGQGLTRQITTTVEHIPT